MNTYSPEVFLCALQIQDTHSSGSVMISISLRETIFRSYQFFIFMYTKLYYFVLTLFAISSVSLQYFQEQQNRYFLFEKWQGKRRRSPG